MDDVTARMCQCDFVEGLLRQGAKFYIAGNDIVKLRNWKVSKSGVQPMLTELLLNQMYWC